MFLLAVAVSDKDALHILQRFAALQHEKLVPRPLQAEFETKLLSLLHKVCSLPGPYVSNLFCFEIAMGHLFCLSCTVFCVFATNE